MINGNQQAKRTPVHIGACWQIQTTQSRIVQKEWSSRFGVGYEGSTLSQQIRAFGTEPNVCIGLKTEYLLRNELKCTHSYFHYQITDRVFSAVGAWRRAASLLSSDPSKENRAQWVAAQFALCKPQLPNYVRFCSTDCCVRQHEKKNPVPQKFTSVYMLLLLLQFDHSLQSLYRASLSLEAPNYCL